MAEELKLEPGMEAWCEHCRNWHEIFSTAPAAPYGSGPTATLDFLYTRCHPKQDGLWFIGNRGSAAPHVQVRPKLVK